ncbi:hypothetical protein FISHEDRAFT_63122 [Fistulina hepatica ATCC 64428]|uniref:DUF6699 domain-containing protein n=1 Tax=Fistulina hepatica ATCC 64428 TaxID=1128425 RepID=A0A0D7A1Q4_9AGAR|nr:hypothetical protein FISHEDRAFT_63122 [Fistulina hepatica ATCC 64428]
MRIARHVHQPTGNEEIMGRHKQIDLRGLGWLPLGRPSRLHLSLPSTFMKYMNARIINSLTDQFNMAYRKIEIKQIAIHQQQAALLDTEGCFSTALIETINSSLKGLQIRESACPREGSVPLPPVSHQRTQLMPLLDKRGALPILLQVILIPKTVPRLEQADSTTRAVMSGPATEPPLAKIALRDPGDFYSIDVDATNGYFVTVLDVVQTVWCFYNFGPDAPSLQSEALTVQDVGGVRFSHLEMVDDDAVFRIVLN